MNRREREKRDNWLPIKHHDGGTVDDRGDPLTEGEATSVASGRGMDEIAAARARGQGCS